MAFVIGGEGNGFPSFTPPAVGVVHNSVCCELVDLGVEDTPWGRKRKGMYIFQTEEEIQGTGTEFDGRRKEVWFRFTAENLDPKSNIRKMLEKWRGKKLTPDEVRSFDLERPVGESARIFIGAWTEPDKNDRQFPVIKADSFLPPALKMKPSDYIPYAKRKAATKANGAEALDLQVADDDVPF